MVPQVPDDWRRRPIFFGSPFSRLWDTRWKVWRNLDKFFGVESWNVGSFRNALSICLFGRWCFWRISRHGWKALFASFHLKLRFLAGFLIFSMSFWVQKATLPSDDFSTFWSTIQTAVSLKDELWRDAFCCLFLQACVSVGLQSTARCLQPQMRAVSVSLAVAVNTCNYYKMQATYH